MKNKLLYVIAFILLITFSACGKNVSSVSVEEMASSIISEFPSDMMSQISGERISNYYDIDVGLIDEYAVYIDGSGGFADELAIYKVSNSDEYNKVKEAINTRVEQRKALFESYSPEEFAKLENASIIYKGDYIMLVVSDDNSVAEKIFADYFK